MSDKKYFFTNKRNAFTLIELLIVIIIITLLGGMLLLSVGPSVAKAKETRCIADRRTLKSEYYIIKAQSEDATSQSITEELLADNSGKITLSGDNWCKGICRSDGTYTFTFDSDGKITISCDKHDKVADNKYGLTFDTDPSSAKNGSDYGGSYYYREDTAGSRYYINGKYYVVYEDLNKGNTKNYYDIHATDIDHLAALDGGHVVQLGDNKGDVTGTYAGTAFTKGTVITYNGSMYVCIKDLSKGKVSSVSGNAPGNPYGTGYWFQLN